MNMNINITSITIGRLFNLGSYEHVRYELTAVFADGESAAEGIVGMEKIINALNPKPPGNVPSAADSARDRARLKEMQALDDDAFQRQHGGYVGTRLQYMARIEEGIIAGEKRREEWLLRAKVARELLDNLGGAAKWTDHKLSWEHSESYFD